MKKQVWIEKVVESSPARFIILFFLLALTGSFLFLALRARANLAAARALQSSLSQQTEDIRTAGSLNDLYDKGWLANERNFVELGGYVEKLVSHAASPSLDPQFKQELSDYIRENRARLPQESAQIERLSFAEGILRQDQSRLLDMYDELGLLFQTMEGILAGWDVAAPQMRGEKMLTIQDAFSTARVEFQATQASHRKILEYARQLGAQSQQASATQSDAIQSNRLQLNLSISVLSASALLLTGWLVFVARH